MNITIKPNTVNIEFNLYNLLCDPIQFNGGDPDYLLELFINISEVENINYLINNFKFLISEDSLLVKEFIKHNSLLAISKILKERSYNEFIAVSEANISDSNYISKKCDFYFTDGYIYIDKNLEKVYKLKNDKLIYMHNFNELANYELRDVDSIYIKEIDFKYISKLFKETEKNYKNKSFVEFIDYIEKEIIYMFADIEELNVNIIEYISDLDVLYYLEECMTEDNFLQFKKEYWEEQWTIKTNYNK